MSMPRRPGWMGQSQAVVNAAAVLILGSALIHFAVAPEHLQAYLPYGLFFLFAGTAQAAVALGIILRPSRPLIVATLAGTLGLIGLWWLSRTIGLPIGPEPGRPEAVGFADIMCVALEAVSVLVLLRLAFPPRKPRLRSRWRVVVGTVPALLLAGLLTYVGVGSAIADMPVAFNASPPVPGTTSTSVASLVAAPGGEPIKAFMLVAERASIDGRIVWTYNGSVPGPELRVTQGDRVRVTLVNHLQAATTIHWHGLRVPNAEDGVAGLTQNAVAPGASYSYEFVATDPGTYWYHSHQDTGSQLPQGLFGALVVEPPPGHVAEAYDDVVMLHSVPGSNAVAVNGVPGGDLRLDAGPGETVRLRIINAVAPGMDGGPETPVLFGAPYRVVALDGHDLNKPHLLGPERIALGMGQRADVVFTMPANGSVRLVDRELPGEANAISRAFGSLQTNETVTIGDGPLPELAAPSRLPLLDITRYGEPAPDPVASGPFDATYPIRLNEGPGFHDGRIELVHTINDQASPTIAPIRVREGQLVRLRITNLTGEFHPMHLHGHVMSVIARDGVPIAGSPLHLDSLLVGPHESWDVAFLADNPGLWMLHCHVLLHASFGMSMTVIYAGITTPFEMGTRSGNLPE